MRLVVLAELGSGCSRETVRKGRVFPRQLGQSASVFAQGSVLSAQLAYEPALKQYRGNGEAGQEQKTAPLGLTWRHGWEMHLFVPGVGPHHGWDRSRLAVATANTASVSAAPGKHLLHPQAKRTD